MEAVAATAVAVAVVEVVGQVHMEDMTLNNIFDKPAQKGLFFLYEAGPVRTTKVWGQPTLEKIKFLVKDIKKIKNYEKYEIFLIGGVVNGGLGQTWDIDIAINGPMNPEEFEAFLSDVYDLALNKHRLLVDVFWLDKKPVNHIQPVEYKVVCFGRVKKQIGDEESILENGKPISKYLVVRKMNFPTKKTLRKGVANFVQI